jgi:hypothetical protein
MAERTKLLINQFSLLICFHTTCFSPFWPPSRIYRQRNVSTFISNLCYIMDPLLMIFVIQIIFYLRLQHLSILKYLLNISKTCFKIIIIFCFSKKIVLLCIGFLGMIITIMTTTTSISTTYSILNELLAHFIMLEGAESF